jgi:hypothetical protein
MKKFLQFGFVICITFTIITSNIKSGSTQPPPNAKVYVDKKTNLAYTPFKANNCSSCIPIKYNDIDIKGYSLYDPTGFNTNGPSLFITILHKIHVFPKPSLRWNDNNEVVEFIE